MLRLDAPLASAYARVALANVRREYPRRLDRLLLEPEPQPRPPRALHPAFYGAYDWHSAVHMHWLLVRLVRLFPDLPERAEIEAVLDAHLAPASLAGELAYFQSPEGSAFEWPYGWAWLLELAAELARAGDARRAAAVAPLATLLATRLEAQLSVLPYPMRAGTHANTAFAVVLALDWARTAGQVALERSLCETALRWYGEDRDAPLRYEPSADDFLSPTLVEALCMKRVLEPQAYARWLAAFLPHGPGPLAEAPSMPDPAHPRLSHLQGLALSRAWCLRRLDARHGAAADRLLDAALPRAPGAPYATEHWLASFAALALGDEP